MDIRENFIDHFCNLPFIYCFPTTFTSLEAWDWIFSYAVAKLWNGMFVPTSYLTRNVNILEDEQYNFEHRSRLGQTN